MMRTDHGDDFQIRNARERLHNQRRGIHGIRATKSHEDLSSAQRNRPPPGAPTPEIFAQQGKADAQQQPRIRRSSDIAGRLRVEVLIEDQIGRVAPDVAVIVDDQQPPAGRLQRELIADAELITIDDDPLRAVLASQRGGLLRIGTAAGFLRDRLRGQTARLRRAVGRRDEKHCAVRAPPGFGQRETAHGMAGAERGRSIHAEENHRVFCTTCAFSSCHCGCAATSASASCQPKRLSPKCA